MKKTTTLVIGFLAAFAVLGGDAAAQPERRVARVAVTALPPTVGNPFHYTGQPYIYTIGAMYEALTRMDDEGNVQPWLATSWRAIDDLHWEVRLRENVTFVNGEPFTADAVVNVIDYLVSEEAVIEVAARLFSFVVGAEAVDSHTVIVETHVPRPDFPRMMPLLYMVEPGQWRRLGRDDFGQEPVGTGPFKVVKHDTNKITLEAYKQSWNPPVLDGLEIIVMPEMAARTQGVQAGSIDLAMSLGPEESRSVEETGGVAYGWLDGAVWAINFVRGKSIPLADARVRKALNLAVNRLPLTEVLLHGVAKPATQAATRIVYGYNPDLEPIPYDPEEAKRLLAEAGYPDGFTFVVEGVVGTGPADASVYQQVTQDLAKVGVTMDFKTVSVAQLLRNVTQGSWKGDGFGLNYEFYPSLDVLRALDIHSCWWTYPWYCDERITPVADEARSEFDPDRALALRRQVAAFYRNEYASLFLYDTPRFAASSKQLKNFKVTSYLINYTEIDFEP